MLEDIYNTAYWGEGYFCVNDAGDLMVCCLNESGEMESGLSFRSMLSQVQAAGLRWPVLIRFTHILRDRVRRLCRAFHKAMQQEQYAAQYVAIYPIKVNQQRRVVEEIIRCHAPKDNTFVGLEAGSKPELIAVLALAESDQSCVVCNGYKDREYIRLALMGEKLGLRVFIVIEKLSELALVIEESKKLEIQPRLGVRIRLSAQGKGNWQNTGGEKSKFGLSAQSLLELMNQLSCEGSIDWLELLHFHMGSQISNVQDIQACVAEATRFYIELRRLGVPIQWFDVGGGLGVDYEGTRSRNYCSINYSLEEYATTIIHGVKTLCEQDSMPLPNIITESGRGLTAHHAVLVTNVTGIEQLGSESSAKQREETYAPPDEAMHALVKALWEDYWVAQQVLDERRIVEIFYRLEYSFKQIQQQFALGLINIQERAASESYYYAACNVVRKQLRLDVRAHRALIDQLNEKLAEKLFVNFSLFKSLPDVWGINQIFPIMPLVGLNQPTERRANIQDITCDSDGRVDQYVDGMGVETTLPLPNIGFKEDSLLGFFLVGAYQEILGDMHNLFGDTDSVDVNLTSEPNSTNSRLELNALRWGDTVESVLSDVNFDVADLTRSLHRRFANVNLGVSTEKMMLKEILAGLKAYTYLEKA